ncbi:MAG: hypothetical protein KBC69_00395 [Candidatus Magasanikbacteria bacterium]|nr:hypothetical protein [Candidatus Magasanikbacteria bacterium]
MPKHRAGGKFSGSHATIIDAAEVVADAAVKQLEVTKVVLGIIEGNVKSKQMRLKFKPVTAGWEIKVYGRISIQTLYVYTSDPEATKSAIERAFLHEG